MDQPNVNQLQNQYLSQGQFPGPGPGVGCGQPGMSQPGMNQPGMNQPGMNQPGLPQPGPQGGMAQVPSLCLLFHSTGFNGMENIRLLCQSTIYIYYANGNS